MSVTDKLTIVVFYWIALVTAYVFAWRWFGRRFGFELDGKYHVAMMIFIGPFVVAIIGVVYLITKLTDKTKTNGGSNEIDI